MMHSLILESLTPTLQSEKFDPDGKFIKKYVPELGLLNKKEIHQPSVFFNDAHFKIELLEIKSEKNIELDAKLSQSNIY